MNGENTINNLILTGLLFQRISELLYEYDIGSCMLGLKPTENSLYSMILGKIDKQEKEKSEIILKYASLENKINQILSKYLPSFMLPYDYILIDEIPLSNNGKIITSKLPKLNIEKKSFILPRNEIEMKMCKIWSSILGIESIGINDDFFRIGGDSISAIQLISRIRNELDINNFNF